MKSVSTLLLGESFKDWSETKLAWKELKGFREACKTADESLLAHWRENIRTLPKKQGLQKPKRSARSAQST